MRLFEIIQLIALVFTSSFLVAQNTGPENVGQSPGQKEQKPSLESVANVSSMPEGMHHDHPQSMQMNHSSMNMNMGPRTFLDEIETHLTSGTSAEPNSTDTPMLMTTSGNWT